MPLAMEDHTTSPLLALPLELREQIYHYLLTPLTSDLIIRSLFIRSYYRNVFMTQQSKGICTSLLQVCRQIHHEVQPMLYAIPLWRCGCRSENLASQIGMVNFGFIKRIQLDVDDLKLVVMSLTQEYVPRIGGHEAVGGNESQRDSEMVDSKTGLSRRDRPLRLRFVNLEMLLVEGYQASSITNLGDRKAREEAFNLCRLAQYIVDRHPTLTLLVQRDKMGNGGSDAVDTTMGRVRWRFIRDERDILPGEHVVDLSEMLQLFEDMLDYDEKVAGPRRSSLPTGWTDTGVFAQYPYLPRQVSRVG